MNHYFDTSALLKAYVEEAGSAVVKAIVDGPEPVGSSVLTYSEMKAVLARLRRIGRLSTVEEQRAAEGMERDWMTWPVMEVTQSIAREAGRLAVHHALTGPDAIHLASALHAASSQNDPLTFWSADLKLVAAARREGLRIGNLGRAG